jgi:hypothetical protein
MNSVITRHRFQTLDRGLRERTKTADYGGKGLYRVPANWFARLGEFRSHGR